MCYILPWMPWWRLLCGNNKKWDLKIALRGIKLLSAQKIQTILWPFSTISQDIRAPLLWKCLPLKLNPTMCSKMYWTFLFSFCIFTCPAKEASVRSVGTILQYFCPLCKLLCAVPIILQVVLSWNALWVCSLHIHGQIKDFLKRREGSLDICFHRLIFCIWS